MAATPVNHNEAAIIAVAVIGPVLAAIFLALRIYARAYLQNQFGADDWVAVATLPFLIAYSACLGIATHHGMGLHIEQMTPATESSWFYWVLISSEFYCCSLFGYKLALLLLYNRLFGVYKWFRYTIYATIFFVFGYLFCNAVTEWASCSPIDKFWLPNKPGHCNNGMARDIAYGMMNIISDFIIAILPMPMIWTLKLRRKEKFLLSLVFVSGGIALAMAIIRTVYAFIDLHSYDRFGIASKTFLISILEVNTGLICSCTPTFRPLFRLAKERASSVGEYIARKRSNSQALNFLRKKSSRINDKDVEKKARVRQDYKAGLTTSQAAQETTLANSHYSDSRASPHRQNSEGSSQALSDVPRHGGMSQTTNVSFITTNASVER